MAVGSRQSINGQPLMLRDSHVATNTFRLNTNYWDGVPKPKFLFYVRFMRSNGGGGDGAGGNLDWTRGIGIIIKSMDRPRVQFETETLNQYNKKRLVQKKINYGPLTIKFHDTVDNRAYHVFEEYFRFYYGDPRQSSSADWSWDQMANALETGSGGSWGFTPPDVDPNYAYFFSHLEVYQIYGAKYSRFDIINPKIVSFDPDELDFSDGSAGAELTMTFEYEGIVYQGNGLDLASSGGLIEEIGLDRSDFYEPSTSANMGGTPSMASYGVGLPTSSYDPTSALLMGGNSAAPASMNPYRSSALTAPNTSFTNIINNLLRTDSLSGASNGAGTIQQVENFAQRLARSHK